MDFCLMMLWWAWFVMLGLFSLPFTALLFHRFEDKGYVFSRILGLVLISYISFVLSVSRLVPFSKIGIGLSIFLLITAELILLKFSPKCASAFYKTVTSCSFWKHAAAEEGLFLVALMFWTFLRGLHPQLDDLEKFMNLGFINSILNSNYMPAPDMWFAGKTINYYYFGHFFTALMIKLNGIKSAIGYNLMMATTFAAAISMVFSLVYNLLMTRRSAKRARAITGGVISSAMVCLAGNYHAFIYLVLLPLLNKIGLISYNPSSPYWFPDATRYIGYHPEGHDFTITEFPLYSFVISDLHAHVMDIFFVLLFIGIALVFLLRAYDQKPTDGKLIHAFSVSPMLLLMGFMIGICGMTNYWDFVIYFIVSVFLVGWANLVRFRLSIRFLLATIYDLILIFALSQLIMLPFTLYFNSIKTGIAIVKVHSIWWQWLVLWGMPTLMSLVFFVYIFFIDRRQHPAALSADLQAQITEKPAVRTRFSLYAYEPADMFMVILLICAIGLIIGPELLYVRDIYEESYPRANTMFKLTYQAFILFGISMGYIYTRIADKKRKIIRRLLVCAPILLAFALALIYPFNAIPAWYGDLTPSNYKGLNGLAFLKEDSADNAEAIDWINQNVERDAIILEANGDSYTLFCQESMATGHPTVMGWYVHEWLWRNGTDLLNARIDDITTIYESDDVGKTRALIKKYGIDYIFIGKYEFSSYSNLNIEKLESLGDVAFQYGDTMVIKIDKSKI